MYGKADRNEIEMVGDRQSLNKVRIEREKAPETKGEIKRGSSTALLSMGLKGPCLYTAQPWESF